MMQLLYVGIGGFIGSALRYLLGGLVQNFFSQTMLPIGTFSVNILGSLLIGLLSGLAQSKGYLSPEMKLLLLVGVLGGFTTFSTFCNETVLMASDGQMLGAMANAVISVLTGLAAVWLGYTIANML